MGFMLAEAAKTDGSDVLDELKKEKKAIDSELKPLSADEKKSDHGKSLRARSKEVGDRIKVLSEGTCDKRRGALEVTRALSLSPFAGDITFNAKSGKKSNTSLYGAEVHATRYQYGIALTPESLRDQSRVLKVIDAVVSLREVGGNHSRFLFDFSPASVVFRWTDDFAPRMLYGFKMDSDGNVTFQDVVKRVVDGDIDARELFVGGDVAANMDEETRKKLKGAEISSGVKTVANKLADRIKTDLQIAGG